MWPWVGVVLQNWDDLNHAEVALVRPDYIYTKHTNIPEDCDLTGIPTLSGAVLVTYEVGTLELGQQLLARHVGMLETFEIEKLLGG